MKRILAFFGAFNPPTAAHIELAKFAKEQTGHEGVMFVPSKSVYISLSQGKDFAYSDLTRLEMLRAAASTRPWMDVTDIEIKAERQPRTYNTLCKLRDLGYEPTLLLGSDKLPELENKWLYVKEMAEEFGILCLARGDDDCRRILCENPFLSSIAERIKIVVTPKEMRNVSSTKVRNALKDGKITDEIKNMLPSEILHFAIEYYNK